MRVNHHLPGSLKNRRRTEALPVCNVEFAAEFAQPAMPLHHEFLRYLVHHRYRVLWHVVQPPLA